jgi:short-subunit dehydrogenase
MSVYGATKAFVTFLSQGLSLELGPKGAYVQAVLPAATRTEIWERASIDVNTPRDLSAERTTRFGGPWPPEVMNSRPRVLLNAL